MDAKSEYLLEVKDLCKSFGEKTVVNHMNFGVKEGEILGFLGPNGAGKSTTIRMITGVESISSGEIFYHTESMKHSRKQLQKAIGIVPQEIAVYNDLNAYDNVRFFCSLYGYRGEELKERTREALTFVGLWEHRKEKPGKYSGGMKRRLNIACAISHSPKLLIMDEPTVGIDPQSRNHIMEAIKKLNQRNTTVIYVSHYMEEIDSLCDRIIIADHGGIIEDMNKNQLLSKYQNQGYNSLEEIFLFLTGTQLRDGEEAK